MSFANAGTTYIVNAANPTTAFISQQHIGNHQQIQGLQQQQQQNVQRIITTNCMPIQQQQQLSQQNCQIIHQQQPPQQQQVHLQQQHLSQQQQQQLQLQPQQQQHQQLKQECQIVAVGAATSQHFGASASNEKPLVRGKTSPYGFFVKMCYEEHKKKYPTEVVQVTEISKKCSQKWKTMSDDEKKRFFELAQKDAERYQAEVAAYGGEDVLRKRKRMKKDPNAPKRALSAFFFFSNEKRPEVQQSHPNWKVGQIAQELGRHWKLMNEDDRQIYDKRALNDKERYAEEMQRYRIETGKPQPVQKQKFKQEDEEEAAAAAAAAAGSDNSAPLDDRQPQSNQLPMQLLDDQQINV